MCPFSPASVGGGGNPRVGSMSYVDIATLLLEREGYKDYVALQWNIQFPGFSDQLGRPWSKSSSSGILRKFGDNFCENIHPYKGIKLT